MPNKRIEEVCITTDIDGNDKLLVVKGGTNQTRSVTVDDFIHVNSINTDEISNCSINDSKICDGAIKTRHLTSNTIDGCIITAGSLDASKITSNSITTDQLTTNGINANCICGGAIDGNNAAIININADNINSGTIDASSVCVTNLNANNITSGTICGDLITGLCVSADCITGLTITANDITTGTLDASCVTVSNLDAACITSGSINANRIASDTIVSCHIDSCSIQTCHLGAITIDAGKMGVDSVGATAICAGSVAANALESNIIIAGSIQSSNFDGFNYVAGATTGDQLLQYLNAGENGFFLDERTGTAVFTDIIARDNVIAANYIKYNEDSGLSAIDATGNFGINLDTDFMEIKDGKVTITRIPADTVVDQSLFLTANTIFFGQSETQEFELPTLNQRYDFFGTNINDTTTWSLSPTTVFVPNLFDNDNYKFDRYLNNELVLYAPNDFRNVGIYNSTFISNSILPADGSRAALDAVDGSGAGAGEWYNPGGGGARVEHVLFVIDLHKYGVTAANVNGNITLNNIKIKYDTSKLNVRSLIESFTLFEPRTYWSSTTGVHSDVTEAYSHDKVETSVTNPTVIGDVFEQTCDINIGHPQTATETGGNAHRYAIVVLRQSTKILLQLNDFPDYRGYVPLSAEFTTDTNLRFEAMGAIPETKNYDLSSINHLIPGQQLVRALTFQRTKDGTNALLPFEWVSDRTRQLGFPEININSPLSGSTALNGGTPMRDILETHGGWDEYTTFNGF
jgi:hypothetical protein